MAAFSFFVHFAQADFDVTEFYLECDEFCLLCFINDRLSTFVLSDSNGNHSLAMTEKQCLEDNITGNCCETPILPIS